MQKYCLPFGWVSSITTTSTWNFSDKFLDARRVDLAGRTQKSDDFWFHGCTYLFETFDSTDPASMPPMSQMALEKQLFAVVQVWSALTCQRIQRDPKRGNLASRLDSEMQSGLDISDMFLRNSRSRYDSFNQFWYSILFGDLRNPPFGCDRGTQVHTVGTVSICTIATISYDYVHLLAGLSTSLPYIVAAASCQVQQCVLRCTGHTTGVAKGEIRLRIPIGTAGQNKFVPNNPIPF